MQNNREENNIYNIEENKEISGYIKRNQEDLDQKDKREYPFENTTSSRWIISIVLLISVFILDSLQDAFPKVLLGVVAIILPVIAVLVLGKRPIRKLFKILTLKDIKVLIQTLLQLFAVVIIFSLIASKLGIGEDFAQNPIGDLVTSGNVKVLVILMLIQLIFEELVFVVPFLFIYHKISSNKKISLIVALLISSEIFGAAHLSTYNYNFLQSLVLIAIVRLTLSMSYIKTKNLTVSYLAHVLYDFILLGLVYLSNPVNI